MQQNQTAIATLPPAERAKVALGAGKAEAQLRELVEKSTGITAVIDMAGREEAHRAGMTLKNARIAIEKTGKAAREDAQAFAKAVIEEEKRLVSIVTPEEKRVLGLRDAYDAKVAAEKAEAERRERDRIARLRQQIDSIRALPMALHGEPAQEVELELAALNSFTPGEDFQEFQEEARAAVVEARTKLTDLLKRVREQEAEAARIAAERAEIERQRQEREAEEARLRAEREAFEAERRAFQEQQEAARRALQDKQEEIAPPAIEEVPSQPEPANTGLNFENYPELDADTVTNYFAVEPIGDDEAIERFKAAVRDLLKTRTADEIRGLLVAELAKSELDRGAV